MGKWRRGGKIGLKKGKLDIDYVTETSMAISLTSTTIYLALTLLGVINVIYNLIILSAS